MILTKLLASAPPLESSALSLDVPNPFDYQFLAEAAEIAKEADAAKAAEEEATA